MNCEDIKHVFPLVSKYYRYKKIKKGKYLYKKNFIIKIIYIFRNQIGN